MGAFFEYEDRGMIAAVADKIEHGALQLICVSTLDAETFYAKDRHPRARIDRYLAYERYLLEDVVPFVKHISGWHTAGVTGCSFGAYHAFTMALRHPDMFTSCIPMGGAFTSAGSSTGITTSTPTCSPDRSSCRGCTTTGFSIGTGRTNGCWSPANTTSAAATWNRPPPCSGPGHPAQPPRLGPRLRARLARVAKDGGGLHSLKSARGLEWKAPKSGVRGGLGWKGTGRSEV